MKAYCYDKTTGQYVGIRECQIDPVRSEREGKDVYLLPGNSTFVAPPSYDAENQFPAWNGKKWVLTDLPKPVPESEAEPTQLDRIEAQVMYTAMMTDTLIEG